MNDDREYRTVPANVETEQELLGLLMMRNDLVGRVSGILKAEDFHEEIHRRLFEMIRQTVGKGMSATPVTLHHHLPDGELAQGVTYKGYLARLLSHAGVPHNLDTYARVVRDLSMRRRLISISQDMQEESFAASIETEPEGIARKALEAIHEATRGQEHQGARGIDEIAGDVFAESAAKYQKEAADCPSTGLPDVDKAIGGGFVPKRLIVIAARPGMGKSLFMTSTALSAAMKGAGVLVYSLELDDRECGARIISDHLFRDGKRVPYVNVLNGWVNEQEIEWVFEARDEVRNLPLRIDDANGLNMADIEIRTRMEMDRMARKGIKLGVVFIDYLQIVKAARGSRESRVEALGEVARAGKEMAKRLGICVVMFSQLNRGVESRDDKRPNAGDIRGSGEIEESADVIGMLYREAFYIEETPEYRRGEEGAASLYLSKQHDLELGFVKNRLGAKRAVQLHCDVKFAHASSKAMI
jgi:replicative DNA helicase